MPADDTSSSFAGAGSATPPNFSDGLVVPFVFVPRGRPAPTAWLARHPGAVRFPATFVARASPASAGPSGRKAGGDDASGQDAPNTAGVAAGAPAAPPPAAAARNRPMAPVRSGASRKPGHTRFNIHTPHPPGGDSAQRRTLAAALVHPGREATPDDVALVARHLAHTLSAKELRRIARDGMGFRVTEGSVGHQKPEWNALPARGYSAGNAVGGRPGTYDEATREVIIATIPTPTGARRVPDSTDSTSADVALHELGHGINRREGSSGKYLSESPEFMSAYVADANHGPLAAYYYHQARRSTDKYDGARDETFAESFAMFVRHPSQMHKDYPTLFAYFEKLLAK